MKNIDHLFLIPFKPRGRDASGCDCWGIVRLAAKELFEIDLPRLDENYSDACDPLELEAKMDFNSSLFHQVKDIRPGCIIQFRLLGLASHVGLALDDQNFIHSLKGQGVAVARFVSPEWHHRIIGVWEYGKK